MIMTRRRALAGAAAAGAAAGLSPLAASVHAKAPVPQSGTQAPSFYRYRVGDFEMTTFSDGVFVNDIAEGFVRNASVAEVNEALEAAHMPPGRLANQFNPVLCNTRSKLVLFDTGNGSGRAQTVGLLSRGLAAAGIDAGTIDMVVISHFHGDHIGGIRASDGSLAYRNAEHWVPADEWAFWMDDGNMSRAPEGPVRNTFQNVRRIFAGLENRVVKYERGKELVTGIASVATTGHTPGHSSFLVASGAGRLIVQGDVTGNPAINLRNPGWHSRADMDGPTAEESRRRLFDMVAAEKMMITGYHYAFPALGTIEKDGTRYRLVPAIWNPVL